MDIRIFTNLDDLAEYIVSKFDFSYKTLSEASQEVLYHNIKIAFNATTFVGNYDVLDELDKKSLLNKIKEKYKITKEKEKERKERIVLNCYLQQKKLNSAIIYKEKQPDFLLKINSKSIGIEITEFKSKDIAVQDKICQKVSGKKLTKEEVEKAGKEVSSTKYNIFEYDSIDGRAIISSPIFDINDHKDEFAQTINNKIKKYKNIFNQFDEFIILINAPDIEITSEYDIYDVLSRINMDSLPHIKLCIIYENEKENNFFECYLDEIRNHEYN